MNKVKENIILLVPIFTIIYLLYFNFNEFTIAQGIIITVFIVTQFYQIRFFNRQLLTQNILLNRQIKHDIYYKKRFEGLSELNQSVIVLGACTNDLLNPLFVPEPDVRIQNVIKNYIKFLNTFREKSLYISENQKTLLNTFLNVVRPVVSHCIAHNNFHVEEYRQTIVKTIPLLEQEIEKEFKKSMMTEDIEE